MTPPGMLWRSGGAESYAFCYGDASVVYALHDGVGNWQTIAPLPDGTPLTVQYDVS